MKNKKRFIIIAGILIVFSASILILTFAIPGKEQLPVLNMFFRNTNINTSLPLKPVILSPDMYLQMGYDSLRNGNYKDAITAYEKATKMMPSDEDVFYNLGVSCLKAGKAANAVKAFKKAAKIKDNDPEIHYNLGAAYSQLRLWRKAIKEYKKAIELNPYYTNAFFNIGIAYGRVEDWNNAIIAFRKLIRINHNDTDAHYNLALIGLITHNQKLTLRHYNFLKATDPNLAAKIKSIQG